MTTMSWLRKGQIALVAVCCCAPLVHADKGQTFKSKRYVIHTDVERKRARQIATHMDAVYDAYNRRFGRAGFRQRYRQHMPLYMFTSRDDYLSFLARHRIDAVNTAGVFFVRRDVSGLATFLEGQSETRLYRVLQHEGFHQFALARIGPNLPIWANEGLAEYFGDAIVVKGKLVTNQVNEMRLRHVVASIRAEEHMPFDVLMNMTGDQWHRRVGERDNASLMYNQSWSIVHFLINGDKKYRKAFDAYLKLINKGQSAGKAYTEAFGGTYEPFEKAWKAYILELKPNTLNTALLRLEFIAQGLRQLHNDDVAVTSLEQLIEKLQAIDFRMIRSSHDVHQVLRATDAENFQPPADPDLKTQPVFELVPAEDESLPPGVVLKGMKPGARLTWSLDEKGKPAYRISFE